MLRKSIFALVFAVLLPIQAWAANCGVSGLNNCFWVGGGNGNWSSSTNWANTSGGASGSGPPAASNAINFDSNSTGTTTVDVDPPVLSNFIISGTYAGTFSNAGNHNFSVASYTNTATGAKTLNLGSGSTWTITSTSATNVWNDSGANTASYTAPGTILLSAVPTGRRGLTFYPVATATYNAIVVTNASPSPFQITLPATAFSAASMTFTNVQQISATNAVTYTLSGALTINSTAANPCYLGVGIGTGTISVGAASTITGCFIQNMTAAGAGGNITATSSFDGGGNTNFNITAPPSGGRIIGG